MKHQGERAASSQKPLWKRILEQRQYRRQLMRARVPLVLFRFWSPKYSPAIHTIRQSHVVRYPLNLQIQLFWPHSIAVHRSHLTLQQFNLIRDHLQRTPDVRSMQSNKQIISVINSYANAGGEREQLREPSGFRGGVGTPPLESKGERSLSVQSKGSRSLSLESKSVIRPAESRGSRSLTLPLKRVENRSAEPKGEIRVRRAVASSGNALKNAPLSSDTRIQATPRVFSNTFLTNKYLGIANRQVSVMPVTTVSRLTRRTVQHEVFLRHAISPELRDRLAATPHSVLAAKTQPIHFTRTFGEEIGSKNATLPRLFALPAWRNFVSAPAAHQEKAPSAQEQVSQAPQRSNVPPPPPPMDIGRLSEEVYRHIQRKIRVERERRGL